MAKRTPKIEVYEPTWRSRDGSAPGFWYWRLIASNGEIVADGAEAYAKRGNALRAARRLKALVEAAVIEVEEE